MAAIASGCADKPSEDKKPTLTCLSTNGSTFRTVYGGCPRGTTETSEAELKKPYPAKGTQGNEQNDDQFLRSLLGHSIDNPDELYNSAISLLLRSNNNYSASRAFRIFLEKFPQDPQAANAMYWIGMIFLADQQLDDAMPYFLNVYQKYPNSPIAAESLLRIGQTQASMGKNKDACTTFLTLRSKYSNAAEMVMQGTKKEEDKLGCQ
jgi:tol-pal system protein YbgF